MNGKRPRDDSDGIITRADLEAIRGVEGGLKAFAEDALERSLKLGPADRRVQVALHPAVQPADRRDADDLASTGDALEAPGTAQCRSFR